jgi:hypothetical protein
MVTMNAIFMFVPWWPAFKKAVPPASERLVASIDAVDPTNSVIVI